MNFVYITGFIFASNKTQIMFTLGEFPHDCWLFNCVTSCVKTPGWLEQEAREEDKQF